MESPFSNYTAEDVFLHMHRSYGVQMTDLGEWTLPEWRAWLGQEHVRSSQEATPAETPLNQEPAAWAAEPETAPGRRRSRSPPRRAPAGPATAGVTPEMLERLFNLLVQVSRLADEAARAVRAAQTDMQGGI